MINVKSTWLCDICKDYRNRGSSKACNSCGAARKKSRYVVRLAGEFYMCHLYTLKHTQLLSVMNITQSDTVFKVGYPSDADITFEIVVQMAQRALEPPAPRSAAILSRTGQRIPAPDGSTPEASLFQKVMDEGTKLAYDSKIGRFVPSDTIDKQRHRTRNRRCSAVVNTDLNYVKFMAQEKRVMKKVVQETIAIRNRIENEVVVLPTFENCVRRHCTMCELLLPEESLVGDITFKTVADWRASHGAPLSGNDHRFDPNNLYDNAPLCLFCTQFFDGNIAGVLEKAADEVKAAREAPKFPRAAGNDSTQVRPLSSIGRSMEISNLKMRALRAGGTQSIGTSSSVSVLEVKAKTAMSMAKINSDLHLYRLREDKIMRKIYQKRRKEFPDLSLHDFKNKLFAAANLSLGTKNKQESSSPTSVSPNSKAKVLSPVPDKGEAASARDTIKKMTLPEIFLAAATNADFRMLADARLLKHKGSTDETIHEEEEPPEVERVQTYDPRHDYVPTKLAQTKSAGSSTRLLGNRRRSSAMISPMASLSKSRSTESDKAVAPVGKAVVQQSWAELLSKGKSPEKRPPQDENDPFALPRLVINEPAQKPRGDSRLVASMSANSVTRKTAVAPVKPPQTDPGPTALESVGNGAAPKDDKQSKAPQWRSTTDASGVFAPVRKLKLREMSKPENQGKPETVLPRKKRSKSPGKTKKGKVEPKKKKAVDRTRRKEKAREQVAEAVIAYTPGEDKNATLKNLGFKQKKTQGQRGRPTMEGGVIKPIASSTSKSINSTPKKVVSFSKHASPAPTEVIKKIQSVPPRPIQRSGSGIDIAKTLRRSDSQQFLDELSSGGGARAQSPDIVVSRGNSVNTREKTVSWEDTMYEDSFEDIEDANKLDNEEFTGGYNMDDFEATADSFIDDGYEADFEPPTRAPSFMEPISETETMDGPPVVAAASIWGDALPPRCPSSHHRSRHDKNNATHDNSQSLRRAYSEEEFEPFEEPPENNEYSDDYEEYSSQEFEVDVDADFTTNENSAGLASGDFSPARPSTSRRSSRGEFVNTMPLVGARAFSPAKCPSSHRRRRRSAGSAAGTMDSPFQSRPSSSVSVQAMSPDKRKASPTILEQRVPIFKKIDSRQILSQDMNTNDPVLEAAMQDYVDMLFSGDGVEEIQIEDETVAQGAYNRSTSEKTVVSASHSTVSECADIEEAKNEERDQLLLEIPQIRKYNPILPRDIVVTASISPDAERRSEDAFEGTKTTRSGAILPRIAHDIKIFPSQLDLTIMRRSGEIGKKMDEKAGVDEDAILSAVAKKLKKITSNDPPPRR